MIAKKIALSLLVFVLTAGLISACSEKEMTQDDIEQLVNDVLVANADVKTVKFDVNMTTKMEMIGGTQPEEATMVGEGTGAIDSARKEMQMIIDMDVDMPGEKTQKQPMEAYLIDGWMHIKVTVEEKRAQWVKMPLPDEMWDEQSQINQQISMLRTAREVNFLGSEDVEGTACYVVEIIPDEDFLTRMVSQIQMPDIEDADLSQFNLANMIKEISFKQWIARDDYLVLKSESLVVMEITPEDIGATEEEFQKITANQSTVMVFYDYNMPVSIELPPEALEQ